MSTQVGYTFEWDPEKNAANVRKHGVHFLKASQIFHDPRAITVFDVWHSDKEERWYTIGVDRGANVLVVNHTHRQGPQGEVHLRLISARKPNQRERGQYFRRKP